MYDERKGNSCGLFLLLPRIGLDRLRKTTKIQVGVTGAPADAQTAIPRFA
jgi:hypothetical protein